MIGAAPDRASARGRVAELLGVTEVEADGVLDLRLLRFTGDERHRLAAELDRLRRA